MNIINNLENIDSVVLHIEYDYIGSIVVNEGEAYIQFEQQQQEFIEDCFFYPPDEGYSVDDSEVSAQDILDHMKRGWTIRLRMSVETWDSYKSAFGGNG